LSPGRWRRRRAAAAGAAVDQLRRPGRELVGIGVLQRELVLGAADRGVDGQILHRLHVERDARDDAGRLALQAADHSLAMSSAALVVRLEIDQEAAAVERVLVPSTPMNEDRLSTSGSFRIAPPAPAGARHGRVGDRLRRLGDALDQAGVLHRKEALGDHDVEQAVSQRAERDPQRQRLVVEHPGERRPYRR
jgi:hypothetical protein